MKPLSEISLAAKIENVATLIQSLKACAREQGISENRLPAIELGIEEAFVNICKYAYPNQVEVSDERSYNSGMFKYPPCP